VGLGQFVPLVSLSVFVGQVADRCDRRVVIAVAQVAKTLAAMRWRLARSRLAHA